MISRIKLYLSRAVRFVISGEPKVFVRVDSVHKANYCLVKISLLQVQVVELVMR